jgi:hypothetical protein
MHRPLTSCLVSLVAIHGLNGHREKTWTSNGKLWLRDFLPERIPNARIMTWGYDANTYSRTEISRQLLYDHAVNLISDLSLERRLTQVGHIHKQYYSADTTDSLFHDRLKSDLLFSLRIVSVV